ncbi:hypothetical protein [uncultured Lactobacillus sp.]|uniref:hypothetical protein n=1 Tax=uncultured Lactobacillus sp. TaxID=153152 RepID=UPI0026089D2E|nr:hypothetical protein [uncultured Lactobacillus sp.]
MLIDNSIKKVMVGSDNIEKIFNQTGTLWQYHYGINTELVFKGDTALLDIDRLPKEHMATVGGITAPFYDESGIYFYPMWCPYDDQHQYYTGLPTNEYDPSSAPARPSQLVAQAPNSYSINTGNLFGTLQTSIEDGGKHLRLTYVNTGSLSPYEFMPTKYVKIKFKF